jgi:uncharacterized membrane protein
MDWTSPVKQLFEFMLPFLDNVPGLRVLAGFAIVFFLPGFAWTLVLFRRVNVLERVALSFGLSIAIVTLGVLALKVVFGVNINGLNSLLTIVLITAVPLAVFSFRKASRRRDEAPPSEQTEA